MVAFFKKIKISYGITVCDEAVELDALLNSLIPFLKTRDEIIVLRDMTRSSKNVELVLEKYNHHIKIIEKKLNGDFSSFKNNLISEAKGDYLFQIDADEIPQKSLLQKLRFLLRIKNKYDCFGVPRINTVEGITPEYIKKWNWTTNEKNYINYPDYQMRLFKLNKGIRWDNKVHEVLVGFERQKLLPADKFDLCLIHTKKLDKQIRQNEFYESL
ncbi:glycosyltransferase [Niabella insulamsoli]|uniref:glycosyltransferase n=1 Tax=Niabella insulamsoli TaxID=3144874 RepID=UPI0031FBAEA7